MARGECHCWVPYPNESHKNKNGTWKCVDKYECVRDLGADGKGKSTFCRRKNLNIADYDEALKTLISMRNTLLLPPVDTASKKRIDALDKAIKAMKFCKFTASEIFDDYWNMNYLAYTELACRRLNEIGVVGKEGDSWTYDKGE